MLDDQSIEALVESARAARDHAHAPYSRFLVGAAVQSASGKVYVGCNVENASFGATLCAERSALAQMVANGEKRAIMVVVFVDADEPAMPCGICRQVIAELGPSAEILTVTPRARKRTTIEQLLPDPFILRHEP